MRPRVAWMACCAALGVAGSAAAQINISVPQLTDVDVSVGVVSTTSNVRGVEPGWSWRLGIETVFISSKPTCRVLERSLKSANARVKLAEEDVQAVASERSPSADVAAAELDAAKDRLRARLNEVAAIREKPCGSIQFELGVGYSQLLAHGRSNLFFLEAGGQRLDVSGWIRDLPAVSLYLSRDLTPSMSAYAGFSIAFSSLSAQSIDPQGPAQIAITGDAFSPAGRIGLSIDVGLGELFAEGAVESQVFSSPRYTGFSAGDPVISGLPPSIGLLHFAFLTGVQVHLQDPK